MYSVQSLMSVKERGLKLSSVQYIHMSSLTLDLLTSKSIMVIYFSWWLVYKVWSVSSKGFSRYWVVSILICPVWPLDLWTSKSIGVIYYSWCTSVLNLKSVKQRYWEDKIFVFPVLNNLDLWSIDLKIDRGLPLLITNPHMKYHNNLMKGSQDTEWTSSGLLTDRHTDRPINRCKAICPSSSKGGHNDKRYEKNHSTYGPVKIYYRKQGY
jgi:hypothetical protein